MDEPFRVEEPRISRAAVLWLLALLLTNVLLALLLWLDPAEPERVPAGAPAQTPDGLRLISELPAEEREARAELARQRSAALPVSERLVCRAWGPFTEAAAIEAMQSELDGIGSALEVRSSEVAGTPDYLVYVSTGNSQDVARRTLAELETQAIDAYVIAGGPYVNAVSVGVFSVEERAVSQRDRVAALGYEVTVQPLSRAQTVYHLIARVPESYAASAEGAASCDAIASLR